MNPADTIGKTGDNKVRLRKLAYELPEEDQNGLSTIQGWKTSGKVHSSTRWQTTRILGPAYAGT